mgnify:CR=1 FL=1
MRDYELMVILRPELPEDERSAQLETIQRWVGSTSGQLENIDEWGRRRLMYEIDNERDGYYLVYKLKLPADAPAELERNLRINENILRYLIIRLDE